MSENIKESSASNILDKMSRTSSHLSRNLKASPEKKKRELEKISVTTCAKLFMTNEDRINFGTKIHRYIENFYLTGKNPVVKSEDEKKVFLHFKEFLHDHPYFEWIDCEKEIEYVYKNRRVVGKIDAVFRNVNNPNNIIIVDWKVKKDLNYEENKTYWYIMNLYAKILENEMPGCRIKLLLVLLHQHRSSYVLVPCDNVSYSAEEFLSLSF